MSINVKIIKQLSDNYAYLLYSDESLEAVVIDPSEEGPILEFIQNKNLKLLAILITHHHSDHTSGISGIKKNYDVDIYSPNKNINQTTKIIEDKDKINLNFIIFDIISTPGHTLDHVVFYCKKEKLLFSGDTLFYYGCGRIFEGTMKQMLGSLKKIKKLSNETQIYCGHEYTFKNLEFVLDELEVFSNKETIKKKYRDQIEKKGTSMPFLLKNQKNWNPFLNFDDIKYKNRIANSFKNKGKISPKATDLEFFTYIRKKRDHF